MRGGSGGGEEGEVGGGEGWREKGGGREGGHRALTRLW